MEDSRILREMQGDGILREVVRVSERRGGFRGMGRSSQVRIGQ
jgi:hypothetical protein